MTDRHLAALCKLQRLAPVVYSRAVDQWVATGYDVVDGLLRSGSLVKRAAWQQAAPRFATPALSTFHKHNVLFSDPPDHSRLRKALRQLYPPGGAEVLRDGVRDVARNLVDGVPRSDEVDLFERFAYPMPVAVICRLLGVDVADVDDFLAWSRALTKTGEIECSGEDLEQAELAAAAMAERVGGFLDDAGALSEGTFLPALSLEIFAGS